MIAALPGTGALDQLTTDIQGSASQLILLAVLIAGLMFLLPPARRLARLILVGALVFTLIVSGLGVAVIDYVLPTGGPVLMRYAEGPWWMPAALFLAGWLAIIYIPDQTGNVLRVTFTGIGDLIEALVPDMPPLPTPPEQENAQ